MYIIVQEKGGRLQTNKGKKGRKNKKYINFKNFFEFSKSNWLPHHPSPITHNFGFGREVKRRVASQVALGCRETGDDTAPHSTHTNTIHSSRPTSLMLSLYHSVSSASSLLS